MLKLVLLVSSLNLATGLYTAPRCHSDSDCAADQCCTSPLLGAARKRIIFDDLFNQHFSGHCQPLALQGHTCEPDLLTFGGSLTHSFGCPCARGLECHGEQESHQGDSHSYTNPKCLPAGTFTATGSQPASRATTTETGLTGSTTQPEMVQTEALNTEPTGTQSLVPETTSAPFQVDPNQPIEELPGK